MSIPFHDRSRVRRLPGLPLLWTACLGLTGWLPLLRTADSAPRIRSVTDQTGGLRLLDGRVAMHDGVILVSGEVSSVSKRPIPRIEIVATAVDAAGTPLVIASALAKPRTIPPGGSGAFSVALERWPDARDVQIVLRTYRFSKHTSPGVGRLNTATKPGAGLHP